MSLLASLLWFRPAPALCLLPKQGFGLRAMAKEVQQICNVVAKVCRKWGFHRSNYQEMSGWGAWRKKSHMCPGQGFCQISSLAASIPRKP